MTPARSRHPDLAALRPQSYQGTEVLEEAWGQREEDRPVGPRRRQRHQLALGLCPVAQGSPAGRSAASWGGAGAERPAPPPTSLPRGCRGRDLALPLSPGADSVGGSFIGRGRGWSRGPGSRIQGASGFEVQGSRALDLGTGPGIGGR